MDLIAAWQAEAFVFYLKNAAHKNAPRLKNTYILEIILL